MSNDDEQDWEVASPANTDQVSKADDEIRNLRAAVKDRLDKEHVTIAGAGAGGEHAVGSARCFVATGDPTPQAGFESGRIYAKSDANYVLEVYDGEWKTIGWALTAHNHTGVYVPEANVVLRNDTHTDASDYCTLSMSSSATSLFDLTSTVVTSSLPIFDITLNGASGITTAMELNYSGNVNWGINIVAGSNHNDKGLRYQNQGKVIDISDGSIGLYYNDTYGFGSFHSDDATAVVEVDGNAWDSGFNVVKAEYNWAGDTSSPGATFEVHVENGGNTVSNHAFASIDNRTTTPFLFDFLANDLTAEATGTWTEENFIRIRVNGNVRFIPYGTLA